MKYRWLTSIDKPPRYHVWANMIDSAQSNPFIAIDRFCYDSEKFLNAPI